MSTTTSKPFAKGDKVSFSYVTRVGTTVTGKGVVEGNSASSKRLVVKQADGSTVTLWPSALRRA